MEYTFYGAAEKPAVVLDIGSRYTKCGFAGEAAPRHIARSRFKLSHGKELTMQEFEGTTAHSKQWAEAIESFLHSIYFSYLQIQPKERRVLLLENLLIPVPFREMLSKVLFEHFQVPSVVYLSTATSVLTPILKTTALVVDCGFLETRVLPIFEEIPIVSAYRYAPLAVAAMQKNLCEMLKVDLNENIAEDILVRLCFFAPKDDTQDPPNIEYPLTASTKLTIPGNVRARVGDIIFDEDNEGVSIGSLILDALQKSPPDTRKALSHNILIVGGTSMMTGFAARLIPSLEALLLTEKYTSSKALSGHFDYIKSQFPANYLSWLGGSILGTLEIPKLSKENYNSFRRIPDWMSLSKLSLVK